MIKWRVSIAFLCFLTTSLHAMEMVPFQELSQDQDGKCYWVARYLHKYGDTLDEEKKSLVAQFFDRNNALSQRVQKYQQSMDYSDEEVITFFQKLSKNEAQLSHCCTLSPGAYYRIDYLLTKRLLAAYALHSRQDEAFKDAVTYFETESSFKPHVKKESRHLLTDAYMGMYDAYEARMRGEIWQNPEKKQIRTFDQMTLAFLVRRDNDTTLIDSHEFDWSQKDAEGLPILNIFDEIYEDSYEIQCGLTFFFHASAHMSLLCKICENSTKNKEDALGYQLTEQEVMQLRVLHKKTHQLEEWQALQNAVIDIDFSPKTTWEKCKAVGNSIKDRVLLAVPLFLVEGLVPAALSCGIQKISFNAAVSTVMHLVGLIPCGYLSKWIGNGVYPWFDGYNSGVGALRKIFGENGVRKIQRGQRFIWLGILNYIVTMMSNCCLYSQHVKYVGVGLKYIGLGLYLVRAGFYAYGVMSTKYTYSDGDRGDLGLFGKMTFNNPLLRKNKEGKYFTLRDLVAYSGK